MLEKYGALQPISADQWRLADVINGMVVSCSIDQAVQKAVEAIGDTPVGLSVPTCTMGFIVYTLYSHDCAWLRL